MSSNLPSGRALEEDTSIFILQDFSSWVTPGMKQTQHTHALLSKLDKGQRSKFKVQRCSSAV